VGKAAKAGIKTNVMRFLEAEGVSYTPLFYAAGEGDVPGAAVAAALGLAPGVVFKTLVLQGSSGGYFVCCVPVCRELDLKKAAWAAAEKKAALIPVKELFPLTGYVRGGCSPFCMKKRLPAFFDESALFFDGISLSAGARGAQVFLSPGDALRLSGGKTAGLTD
jgi:Cys-tRNA(Pro)/Cys-tRNA(Cys) deacylase